jgi:ABC-type enterochelin transport system substrate-binding protein
LSNHKISNLNEQSRRNNILINELVNDVNALETELSELDSENRYYSNEIQHMKRITQQTDEYVHNTKRKLMAERKEL